MVSISIDILAIIALFFTIYLAKRNVVVNNYKNKIYILLAALTIALLTLEIATVLMALSADSKLVIPHRLANLLGFALSPVFPYIFLFFNNTREKVVFKHNYLAIPIYLNALICALSYKTGWVFYVDAQNQYIRGDFFLLPFLVSMIYFALIVIEVIKNTAAYEIDDRRIVFLALSIPILGTMLQILYNDILIIWGSIAIFLVLFYIFLRELQFKYDVQTGTKNRVAFQKEIEQYLKSDKNAAIVILDINNLKRINDEYGHKVGDETIALAAGIINQSFTGIGRVYRIGGDEFCVICDEPDRESIEKALLKLEGSLAKINEERGIKIVLAYGYALYRKNKDTSINSALEQADKAMYEHKATLKREPYYFQVPPSVLP